MSTGHSPVCEIAIANFRNLARWRNLWTILLFAFGFALTIFAILAIVNISQGNNIQAVVTGVGSLAQGLIIGWVANRRDQARKEEAEALLVVEKHCAFPSATRMATGNVPGVEMATLESAEPTPESRQLAADLLREADAKYSILGMR